MSLVELRVELPAYSHSFVVQVPQSSSILDVKQEIAKSCIGAPRVDGQRIIWRGRYLLDDEKVDDIWKALDEPRVVHLAVHPSAWGSSPPPHAQASAPSSGLDIPAHLINPPLPRSPPTPIQPRPQPQFLPSFQRPTQQPAPPRLRPSDAQPNAASHPLAYIQLKHQNALLALTQGRTVQSNDEDLAISRARAKQVVERHGWSWPAILDEEFPPATEGGVKYERVTVNGQAYLQLRDSSADPTPLQIHALKVLTYTFSLITLPAPSVPVTHVMPSASVPVPLHVNQLLQQLGLPQLRAVPHGADAHPVANNQNANQNGGILPELRDMPLRPLLIPFGMLIVRTLLLLYFVAPARKPVIGLIVLALVIYEGWRPIRDGLMNGWRRGAVANQAARDDAPPAAPAPPGQNPEQPAQPAAPRPPAAPAAPPVNQLDEQVFDFISNVNLETEERSLATGPGTPPEPNLGHKIVAFLGLLIVTIHPAVWNRRRAALRRREGRVRTEANARRAVEGEEDTPENAQRAARRAELVAQHARRPQWIQSYIERVVQSEWVDESD